MLGIGKVAGYIAKALRKAPKANILSRVETNTTGRILRMQNAKQAFTLGPSYQSVYTPMKNTSGYRLVTQDASIGEKLAQMYPQRTNATRIAELRKRLDCRAAFNSDAKPVSRLAAEFANITENKIDAVKNVRINVLNEFLGQNKFNCANIAYSDLKKLGQN